MCAAGQGFCSTVSRIMKRIDHDSSWVFYIIFYLFAVCINWHLLHILSFQKWSKLTVSASADLEIYHCSHCKKEKKRKWAGGSTVKANEPGQAHIKMMLCLTDEFGGCSEGSRWPLYECLDSRLMSCCKCHK